MNEDLLAAVVVLRFYEELDGTFLTSLTLSTFTCLLEVGS